MLKIVVPILVFLLFLFTPFVTNANNESQPLEKAYFEIGYKSLEDALDDCETYSNKNITLPFKLPPVAFTHSFGRCSTDNYGVNAGFEVEYLNENSPKTHYKINIKPKVHRVPFRPEKIDRLYDMAVTKEYTIVAKVEKDDIILYAKERNGLYVDFKIGYKGSVSSRPFWINVTNSTYAPQMIYEDINNNKNKELVIILTNGYGTGVLEEEVHVFDTSHDLLKEVLVDNPIAIINKNIKTKLSRTKAEISIVDRTYQVDISPLKIIPENLFKDIYFGNITKYEVKDNKLNAYVAGQIAPAGGFIGNVVIVYEFRDKMYQAKSIYFEQY